MNKTISIGVILALGMAGQIAKAVCTRQSGQPLSTLRWLLLLTCLLLSNPCLAKTLHVDDNAPAGGDGLRWTSAFCYLQDALAAAEPNDEIRVAQGLYYPDRGENLVPGDRSATFELQSDVVLLGGYGGLSCEDPNRRDVDQYAPVLSGDLLDNDLQGAGLLDDNSFHIITAIDIEGQVVLDGFIIQGGNANWENRIHADHWGGGVSIVRSQVLIQDCRFEGNSGIAGAALMIQEADPRVMDCAFAGNTGGCIYLLSSDSVFRRCVFENNQGGRGGAVQSSGLVYGGAGDPSYLDCVFVNNRASSDGGAIFTEYGGRPTFRNCRFINNHAGAGGAISMVGHDIAPVFHGCLFAGNQAATSGGALYLMHTRPLFEYCTLADNQAQDRGGAICIDGQTYLALSNSILWHNRATEGPQVYFAGSQGLSSLHAMYCSIEGALLDVALIGTAPVIWQHNLGHDLSAHNPRFVNSGSWRGRTFTMGDYHLKSQAGRWNETTQAWVQDAVTSPCIDAGDPASPIGLEPFPNGGLVNMGAYGGTGEASKSYFGKSLCETIVAGDINGDGRVDFRDFAVPMQHWLEAHDHDNE
jgi:predicted outer membrane repeat protein